MTELEKKALDAWAESAKLYFERLIEIAEEDIKRRKWEIERYKNEINKLVLTQRS